MMRFNIQLTLLFFIYNLIYSQGFIDDIVSEVSEVSGVGRDINSFFDDIIHPTPTRRKSTTSNLKPTKTSSIKTSSIKTSSIKTSSSLKSSRSSSISSIKSSTEEESSMQNSSEEIQATRTLSRQIVNNATSYSITKRSSIFFVLAVYLGLSWII